MKRVREYPVVTPVLAIKSSIAGEPVTYPAWAAHRVPRRRAKIPTSLLTDWRLNASGRDVERHQNDDGRGADPGATGGKPAQARRRRHTARRA